MAKYANLKADIQAAIKQNGNQEITGNLLQQSLIAMINSLGNGYLYKGIATPSTEPGTPDQNVFYIAATAGIYANFGTVSIGDGEVAILKYNGSWIKDTTNIATATEVSRLSQNVNVKLERIPFKETQVPKITTGDGQNIFQGYITEQGAIGGTGSSSYGYLSINVQGYDYVHFLGLQTDHSAIRGYAFYDANNNVVIAYGYEDTGIATSYKDYLVPIPSGATTFRTNVKSGNMSIDDFYCYLVEGDDVKGYVDKTVNNAPYIRQSNIKNNLLSDGPNDVLSAGQGKLLGMQVVKAVITARRLQYDLNKVTILAATEATGTPVLRIIPASSAGSTIVIPVDNDEHIFKLSADNNCLVIRDLYGTPTLSLLNNSNVVSTDIILLLYSSNLGRVCTGYLYNEYLNAVYNKIAKSNAMPVECVEYNKKTISKTDGTLNDGSTSSDRVKEFAYEPRFIYWINGSLPSSNSNAFVAFYDSQDHYLGHSEEYGADRQDIVTDALLSDVPDGTVKVRMYYLSTKSDGKIWRTGTADDIQAINRTIGITSLAPVEKYVMKGIYTDGSFFNTSSVNVNTLKFEVEGGKRYLVSGYSPSDTNLTRTAIVCEDEYGVVLSHYKPTATAGFVDFVLSTPVTCKYVLICEDITIQSASIKEYTPDFDRIKIDNVPQIYDTNKEVFETRQNIRILCFGSSWFMNTWWYLNKIIGATSVNCEIHAYYMGHAKMREWIEFYKGQLTPFSGTEASRTASKNISINGSDWTKSTYSSSGAYNAQSYRDDFYNDLIAGNWDIIAFQQGAQESIIAAEWAAKEELLTIIRSNCSYKTRIAFNATWVPALRNYTGDYFPTISRSDDGKMYFQQLNNINTKLFIADTGILKVSPNGAMMSLMRADASLNTGQNDMADDGLHPNNGLPMLGLCGCFYETFVAPMIGVSFDTLAWLPTSSTQKASVSHDSFDACSAAQLALIKKHIKEAAANRFKYYE